LKLIEKNMKMHTFMRSVYRRTRTLPVLGTFVEALRYRRFPSFWGAGRRYAQQQNILEAHGHALAGLRHGLGRIEQELYAQIHRVNMAADAQREKSEERLEFVRKEILYEFRYTAQPSQADIKSARIVSAAKVESFKRLGNIRLNVGCGHKPDKERINVDMRELPDIDVIAPVDALPFDSGEVFEIYSSHVLEHFPHEHLARRLLPYWCKLLQSGGSLRAVVPDGAAMLDAYAKQEVSFANLRLVLYGGQEYEGDFHHTMFTPESLADLFASLGLTNVRIEARQRRNGLCYECEVVGVKP
jgi:hypothetical protein